MLAPIRAVAGVLRGTVRRAARGRVRNWSTRAEVGRRDHHVVLAPSRVRRGLAVDPYRAELDAAEVEHEVARAGVAREGDRDRAGRARAVAHVERELVRDVAQRGRAVARQLQRDAGLERRQGHGVGLRLIVTQRGAGGEQRAGAGEEQDGAGSGPRRRGERMRIVLDRHVVASDQ